MIRNTGPKLECILCVLNHNRSSKRQAKFTTLHSIKHVKISQCVHMHTETTEYGDFKDGLNPFGSIQSSFNKKICIPKFY